MKDRAKELVEHLNSMEELVKELEDLLLGKQPGTSINLNAITAEKISGNFIRANGLKQDIEKAGDKITSLSGRLVELINDVKGEEKASQPVSTIEDGW